MNGVEILEDQMIESFGTLKPLIPTLRGKVVGKDILVYCPFCDGCHKHGLAFPRGKSRGRGNPMRKVYVGKAKCKDPRSPLYATGYFVAAPWPWGLK